MSMTNSDFKPDYLSHILNDEEDEDYQQEMNEIDIRFLNVGGYVIPLVSPKFMSDLVHNDEQKEKYDLEEKIDGLEEKLEDLEQELIKKSAIIKQQDGKINSLKGENSNLKQFSSRQSLLGGQAKILLDDDKEKKQIEKLQKEIEAKNQYITKLSFYMKENN